MGRFVGPWGGGYGVVMGPVGFCRVYGALWGLWGSIGLYWVL